MSGKFPEMFLGLAPTNFNPFEGTIEVGTCMKCGQKETELTESRDGDGYHACARGCGITPRWEDEDADERDPGRSKSET